MSSHDVCVTWPPFWRRSFNEESIHWIASTVNRDVLGLFFFEGGGVVHTGTDVI